jgi:hypothetical protein
MVPRAVASRTSRRLYRAALLVSRLCGEGRAPRHHLEGRSASRERTGGSDRYGRRRASVVGRTKSAHLPTLFRLRAGAVRAIALASTPRRAAAYDRLRCPVRSNVPNGPSVPSRRLRPIFRSCRVFQRRGHGARRAAYAVPRGLCGAGSAVGLARCHLEGALCQPCLPAAVHTTRTAQAEPAHRKQCARPAHARPPRLAAWPFAAQLILRRSHIARGGAKLARTTPITRRWRMQH